MGLTSVESSSDSHCKRSNSILAEPLLSWQLLLVLRVHLYSACSTGVSACSPRLLLLMLQSFYRLTFSLRQPNPPLKRGRQRNRGLQRLCTRADLYSILQVPETATKAEIKSAYRRLVRRWHPDLNPEVETTTHFQVILACMQVPDFSTKAALTSNAASHGIAISAGLATDAFASTTLPALMTTDWFSMGVCRLSVTHMQCCQVTASARDMMPWAMHA